MKIWQKTLNLIPQSELWIYRYDKVLGTKKYNVIEALFEKTSRNFIFNNGKKKRKKKKRKDILSQSITDESYIFFDELHVTAAIGNLNKNSSPSPNRITLVLIENRGQHLIKFHVCLLWIATFYYIFQSVVFLVKVYKTLYCKIQ